MGLMFISPACQTCASISILQFPLRVLVFNKNDQECCPVRCGSFKRTQTCGEQTWNQAEDMGLERVPGSPSSSKPSLLPSSQITVWGFSFPL